MKQLPLRTQVRMGKFIAYGVKPNYKKLFGSFVKTYIAKGMNIKRPRMINLFIGRNKY